MISRPSRVNGKQQALGQNALRYSAPDCKMSAGRIGQLRGEGSGAQLSQGMLLRKIIDDLRIAAATLAPICRCAKSMRTADGRERLAFVSPDNPPFPSDFDQTSETDRHQFLTDGMEKFRAHRFLATAFFAADFCPCSMVTLSMTSRSSLVLFQDGHLKACATTVFAVSAMDEPLSPSPSPQMENKSVKSKSRRSGLISDKGFTRIA